MSLSHVPVLGCKIHFGLRALEAFSLFHYRAGMTYCIVNSRTLWGVVRSQRVSLFDFSVQNIITLEKWNLCLLNIIFPLVTHDISQVFWLSSQKLYYFKNDQKKLAQTVFLMLQLSHHHCCLMAELPKLSKPLTDYGQETWIWKKW